MLRVTFYPEFRIYVVDSPAIQEEWAMEIIVTQTSIYIISLFAHLKNGTYIHWFKTVNTVIKTTKKTNIYLLYHIIAHKFH